MTIAERTAPFDEPYRTTLQTLQIGTIVGRAPLGGGERYFFDLLRALPAHDVGTRGLIVGDPGALDAPCPGLESVAPDAVGRLARWRGLRRSVAQHVMGTDLVVSHMAPHAFPVLDLIRSRPLVVHFHHPIALAEWNEKGVRAPREWVQEYGVYRRAARAIVLSQAFGRILERGYRIAPDRIRVIPGGVDTARFRPRTTRRDARALLGLPLDRPLVVAVRRLVRDKGLHHLIDAFADVRRDVPDAYLAIGGTGPERAVLAQRIAERGLTAHARLLGHVDEALLPLLYRAGDLSIVPTTAWEGFGLVIVESLAAGTPVLVTPVGGMPEAVRDLDPALVLDGNDRASIAAGLRAALDGALPLPGDAACVAYAARFDWHAIAARVRDVYEEVR